MSSLSREGGHYRKIIIGLLAAGTGVAAYYGYSKWKSRPVDSSPGSVGSREDKGEVEHKKDESQTKISETETKPNESIPTESHPKSAPSESRTDSSDNNLDSLLSLSGSFEKVSLKTLQDRHSPDELGSGQKSPSEDFEKVSLPSSGVVSKDAPSVTARMIGSQVHEILSPAGASIGSGQKPDPKSTPGASTVSGQKLDPKSTAGASAGSGQKLDPKSTAGASTGSAQKPDTQPPKVAPRTDMTPIRRRAEMKVDMPGAVKQEPVKTATGLTSTYTGKPSVSSSKIPQVKSPSNPPTSPISIETKSIASAAPKSFLPETKGKEDTGKDKETEKKEENSDEEESESEESESEGDSDASGDSQKELKD